MYTRHTHPLTQSSQKYLPSLIHHQHDTAHKVSHILMYFMQVHAFYLWTLSAINIALFKCFGESGLEFASIQYMSPFPLKEHSKAEHGKLFRGLAPCIPVKKPGKTAQASLCAGNTWNVSRSPSAMRAEWVQGWVSLMVWSAAFSNVLVCVYVSHIGAVFPDPD